MKSCILRVIQPYFEDKDMPQADKSLESWIWDAACPICEAKDAPKYKDYNVRRATWRTTGSAT